MNILILKRLMYKKYILIFFCLIISQDDISVDLISDFNDSIKKSSSEGITSTLLVKVP